MGEKRRQPSFRTRVAALARQRGRNVIRRLAECGNTIVTGGTWLRESGVIHLRRGAGIADGALVARIALSGGDKMIDRFTERDRTIVAGRARCVRLDMIDETQVAPRRCKVTALTEVRCLRMPRWLALGVRRIVTGETLLRRTFETPVAMARCAIDARMRPGQGKAGRKMIE